jgi:hypothetical protein
MAIAISTRDREQAAMAIATRTLDREQTAITTITPTSNKKARGKTAKGCRHPDPRQRTDNQGPSPSRPTKIGNRESIAITTPMADKEHTVMAIITPTKQQQQ